MSPQVSNTPTGETMSRVPFSVASSMISWLGIDPVDEADAGDLHQLGHPHHLQVGQVGHQQGLVRGLVEQVAHPVAGVDPGDLGRLRRRRE